METDFDKAMRRPSTYHYLPMSRQWEIDGELGILDWNGEMTKEQRKLYRKEHPSNLPVPALAMKSRRLKR